MTVSVCCSCEIKPLPSVEFWVIKRGLLQWVCPKSLSQNSVLEEGLKKQPLALTLPVYVALPSTNSITQFVSAGVADIALTAVMVVSPVAVMSWVFNLGVVKIWDDGLK